MQTNLMKNSEYQKDSTKTIRPNGCEKMPRSKNASEQRRYKQAFHTV